jgi:hypothetical protein
MVRWGNGAVEFVLPSVDLCCLWEESDFARGELEVVLSQSREDKFPVLDGLVNRVAPNLDVVTGDFTDA